MDIEEDTKMSLHQRILGTWNILSWKRTLIESGEESDAFGPNPTGYINYAPDNRLMVLVLQGNRLRPSGNPPTEREKVALFDSMFAYAGTYVVELDRVIHNLDASWNELWTGTLQTRFISFENNRLIYTTPETVDPMDGKLCTYKVELSRP
jgi:Lipocalin-like domain